MKKIILFLLSFLLAGFAAASEAQMKNILIVYGSFSGSTAEVADTMKACLQNKSCPVTLMQAEGKRIDLENYDLVILGSAIHGDNIHGKIKEFVDANRSALNKRKVAAFAVCITITSSKPNKRKHALTYPTKVACGISPISTAVFAGKAPSSGPVGNFFGKLLLGVVPGDFRDWDRIKVWTQSLLEIR